MIYLFDFDGTLVDSMPIWAGVHMQALHEAGIPCPDNFVQTITPLGNVKASQYTVSLGLKTTLEEYLADVHNKLCTEYSVNVPLKSYVPETLKHLKEAGHSLNVLTASPHCYLDVCLKRHGIYDLFDHVWSIDDFHYTKSETALYTAVADRLNVKVSECVLVDDNYTAVVTAQKAGMNTIGVYDRLSEDYVDKLKKAADFYISDFREIPIQRENRKMKISIENYILTRCFGEPEAIKMLKEAGFDCVDYSFYGQSSEREEKLLGENYVTYAQYVRGLLDEANIECNQAHAPFTITCDDAFTLDNRQFLKIVRSMESAAIMGAKYIVVHAVYTENDIVDFNYKFYKSLEPYCKKIGIKIAIENLFVNEKPNHFSNRFLGTPALLNELLVRLNSDWFVACVDIGHAALTGNQPDEFIRNFDCNTLKVLHVQDNNFISDAHLLPYLGSLNWNTIVQSLADIKYNGELTLEVFKFLNRYRDSGELMQHALNFSALTAKHLSARITALQEKSQG